MARVRSAQHPRRFCATIIFLLPVRTAATRTRALRAFAAHLGLLVLGGGKNSTGFPPAETGWDLYLPSLERARARQGSVLQPFSLSTRTCGRALSFPEVDASSALTNGPRFKYTLPWQLFCSKRPLRLAKPRSWQLDQLLSQRPTAHARNESHMPIAFVFSDSDEFSEDPRSSPPPSRSLGSRSPRIPRSFSPPSNLRVQLHQLSSQPSNTLGHGARHACEAFVSMALSYTRNTAATLLLPAFVLACQTPLVLDQLLSERPTAHARNESHMPIDLDFSDSDEFSEDPRSSPPPSRSLGNRPPRILRSFAGATTSPGPIFPSSFESSFVNSHRSRLRFSATVYDMHLNVLAAIILGLIIKVLSAVTFLRNTASTPLLQTLVTTCSSSLEPAVSARLLRPFQRSSNVAEV
ncbi:hypothetical protein DFH06DRAFT_1323579 [Mycena polygramma]|nr:hypothetical protein DFH06DRAFT_1323579 [Mycena polygramma]